MIKLFNKIEEKIAGGSSSSSQEQSKLQKSPPESSSTGSSLTNNRSSEPTRSEGLEIKGSAGWDGYEVGRGRGNGAEYIAWEDEA